MYILGISAFYHDSAAALIKDGEIVAAAQEERFTRKKHDPSFPVNAVKFCLEYEGITIDDLEAVVFYDKPLLKFERLLETYYFTAPKSLTQFLSAIPVWIKEKLMIKKTIKNSLKEIADFNEKKLNILFSEHHLSHIASAFYPSPFEKAAVLTIDGVGEWATSTLAYGEGNNIKILKELLFPNSVGLLYSSFTYFLGFKVNSGEYKLMGLAPYGNPNSEQVKKYKQLILDDLVDIKEDGSVYLNQDYFQYTYGLKMIDEEKWKDLFGFEARKPETPIEQYHCDLALAIQEITEDIVIKMAKHVKDITGADNLCMAGGVALNCVANGKLLKTGIFKDIWIQPAAGDAGGALGAALAVYYMKYNKPRKIEKPDSMKGSYLGAEYCDKEIEYMIRKYNANYKKFKDFENLAEEVAKLIADGNVIGWFQGKMEWGPRALGNRSILGDARNPEMQKKLNLKIKFRESFRPFAPAVLHEDVSEYFELDRPSPYMLLVANVKKERRKPLPENYHNLPIKDKLYYLRSDIPAVTHIDYSARIQTVHKETNPRFYTLLKKFKELTGYSVVVNTSFNVRGEPIVMTPEDAYKCFMRTNMDYLVINNYLFDKKLQPKWKEELDWREIYELD